MKFKNKYTEERNNRQNQKSNVVKQMKWIEINNNERQCKID